MKTETLKRWKKMTKREILKQYAQGKGCTGIHCRDCPCYKKTEGCLIESSRLMRIGAMAILKMFPETNFNKSRIYTALNADELKIGSKVIVADDMSALKKSVLEHRLPRIIEKVESEDWEHRFLCDDVFHYAFAYLVE